VTQSFSFIVNQHIHRFPIIVNVVTSLDHFVINIKTICGTNLLLIKVEKTKS